MEDKNYDSLPEAREDFYNEKNDAVLAPDSYYSEKKDKGFSEEERYYEVMESGKVKTRAFSVISLILGVISILFSFIGWIGFLVGAVAIIFSVISRIKLGYFDSMSIAGLILGIFGAVFGLFYIVIALMFGPEGLAGITSDFSGGTGTGSSLNDI